MTLGKRIYEQRTARGLSQTDLAVALGVSRQSVSKWETDASVPDLDKLLKLCEIFGISMDCLVRSGEASIKGPQGNIELREEKSKLEIRRIIGLILIIFGLLCFMIAFFWKEWGLDDAALYSVPLLIWGMLCLRCKRHPVLACFWGLWGMYTGILSIFLCSYGLSSPQVNLFIPPNLLLLSLLVFFTAWVRNREEDAVH